MKTKCVFVLLVSFYLCSSSCLLAEDTPDKKPGIVKRVVYYIPNRILDFLDIFKARVSVGPGLSGKLRVTDYGSLYMGRHRAAYLGFPGSRHPEKIKWPFGLEREEGIVFFGIDATDDFKHDPVSSSTEVSFGAHFLLIGADFGFDPIEMVDFFAGLIFIDWRGDDIGSIPAPDLVADAMVEWQAVNKRKPAKFKDIDHRLDYIQTNLAWGIDARVERFDSMFAGEQVRADRATSQFMFGFYIEPEEDDGFRIGFDPDFSLDVELPKLEQKYNVYFTGEQNDELPGTNPTEREGGSRIGVKRSLGDMGFDVDAGIKWDWPPVLFSGIEWSREYYPAEWKLRPSLRGYYESDDGWGQVSSLYAYKWLGDARNYAFRSVSAGRWTEDTEGWEWEQSVTFGRVKKLIGSRTREGDVGKDDLASGYGMRYSIFGHVDSADVIDRHRLTFAYRRPLHKNWIYLSVEPEVEWVNEKDWDYATRLRIGIDALFWDVGRN